MIDKIFGTTFWGMVTRAAIVGGAISFLAGIANLITAQVSSSVETPSLILLVSSIVVQAVVFSWVGWGLAFWRFDRDDIPVKSFFLYPAVSGLIAVPGLWYLVSATQAPDLLDYVWVTLFGVVAGPFMAVLLTAFISIAPRFTDLQKYRQ